MKTKRIFSNLFLLLLLIGVFIFPNFVRATVISDFGGDGTGLAGGSVTESVSLTNSLPADFYIGQVDFYLEGDSLLKSTCAADTFANAYAEVVYNGGTVVPSNNNFKYKDLLYSGSTPFLSHATLYFNPPVHITSHNLQNIVLVDDGEPTGVSCVVGHIQFATGPPGSSNWDFSDTFGVHSGTGLLGSITDFNNGTVDFAKPSFNSGFSSPDFANWWVCPDIPPSHSLSAYDVAVTYGTSTPSGPYIDDLASHTGNVPLASGTPETGCVLISKQTPLSPGSYQAQATLFDQNGVSVALSPPIGFSITTSTPSSTPPTVPGNGTGSSVSGAGQATCPATSFSVFGADIGQGLCDVAAFVFVPSQASLSQFTGTQSIMATKPPFNFLYNLSATLDSISTSSTSTFAGLTINTGTSTPIRISADMFSPTTLNKFTDTHSRSVIRTLCEYAIYLGFAAMVILEVRGIFKKGKEAK